MRFPLNGGGGPVMLPGGGHNFGPVGGGMGDGLRDGMGHGPSGQDGRLAGLLGQVQAFRDARHDWRDGGREGDRPRLSAFIQQFRQQQGFDPSAFGPGPFAHRGSANY